MALERSGTPQPPYAPDPYKWVGLRVQFSVYGLPPKYLRFIGRGPSVPAAVLGTVAGHAGNYSGCQYGMVDGYRPWRHGCLGGPAAASLGARPSWASAGAAGRRIPCGSRPSSL